VRIRGGGLSEALRGCVGFEICICFDVDTNNFGCGLVWSLCGIEIRVWGMDMVPNSR
jgi:hypothetical protein